MSDDFAWLTEHSRENYEKYDTAVEAADRAESEHPSGDYILEKVERDVDVIYACLRMAQRADPPLRRTARSLRIGGDQGPK
jgi:hypothetical protein